MNFDQQLRAAWQGETRQPAQFDLVRRVRWQRHRHRLQRAVEVALTLVAGLVFGHALVSGQTSPSHWLLLPFYIVFLPVAWTITLRAPRRRTEGVTERVSVYARLRLAQLRSSLRDVWLARAAAWALLGYAVAANVAVWQLAGAAHWRSAGFLLLVCALAWLGVTLGLSRMLRHRWLREYRAVRRLVGN